MKAAVGVRGAVHHRACLKCSMTSVPAPGPEYCHESQAAQVSFRLRMMKQSLSVAKTAASGASHRFLGTFYLL